jgi:hypothetical protein
VLCYGEDAVFVVVKMLRGVIDELEFLHYFVFVFTFVVRAGIYAPALSSSTISYAASTGSNMASLFSFLTEHNSSQHAAKIPCWTALFSLTSTQATKSIVAPLLAQEISKRALRDWRKFQVYGEWDGTGSCGGGPSTESECSINHIVVRKQKCRRQRGCRGAVLRRSRSTSY